MKCNLNKPQACFNCPHPDCIDSSVGSKEETAFLNGLVKEPERCEYFSKYYKNLDEAKKGKKRRACREWYRQHAKEQTAKRRQYMHDYWIKKKRKKENAKAI